LIEVADHFKFQSQTLFLAVNYVDRFLERPVTVTRVTLQLVGVACMLIAAKYEEIFVPLIDEFVVITDNTYTRDEILKTEHLVLNVLQFRLTVTTVKDFISQYFCLANVQNPQVEQHASYLAEFLLPYYQFRCYKPSKISAAIICLSRHTFNITSWSPELGVFTLYNKLELMEPIHQIQEEYHRCFFENSKLSAAREKYSKQKHGMDHHDGFNISKSVF